MDVGMSTYKVGDIVTLPRRRYRGGWWWLGWPFGPRDVVAVQYRVVMVEDGVAEILECGSIKERIIRSAMNRCKERMFKCPSTENSGSSRPWMMPSR